MLFCFIFSVLKLSLSNQLCHKLPAIHSSVKTSPSIFSSPQSIGFFLWWLYVSRYFRLAHSHKKGLEALHTSYKLQPLPDECYFIFLSRFLWSWYLSIVSSLWPFWKPSLIAIVWLNLALNRNLVTDIVISAMGKGESPWGGAKKCKNQLILF